MFDELLAIGEAAKRVGVSQDTLRNWEEAGRIIPERTPGGHRRYRLTDLKLLQIEDRPAAVAYREEFQKALDDPSTPPHLRRLIELHLMSYQDLVTSSLTEISKSVDLAVDEAWASRPAVSLAVPDLDRALGGGIHSGRVGLITGPACSFKSVLAQQIALQAAASGKPAVLFALEAPRRKTVERLVAQSTGTPITEVRLPDFEAKEKLAGLPEQIVVLEDPSDPEDDERAALTPKWIEALVKAAALERFGGDMPALVVIDSLPHLHPDRHWKRYGRGAVVMEELSSLAEALGVAVLVTCSAPKGQFPSGPYAQVDFCDFVVGLKREDDLLDVSLLKNRFGESVDLELAVDTSSLQVGSRG